MPLAKSIVPLTFGAKLDTKSDPKQLQTGLVKCENAYMERRSELRKRNGFSALSSSVIENSEGITTLPLGKQLATFGDELVLLTDDYAFGYASQIDRWVYKGELASVQVSARVVIANSSEQTTGDTAYAAGVSVFAYRDARGGVRASAIDAASGAFLVRDVLLNSSATRMRCMALGNYLYVFYYNVTDTRVECVRLDARAPSAFGAPAVIASNIATIQPVFDVCTVGARMVFCYRTTGGNLRVQYVLQSGAVGTTTDGVPDPTDIVAITEMTVMACVRGADVGGTPTVHIAYADSTEIFHIAVFGNFAVYLSEQDDTTALNVKNNLGLVVYDGVVDIYYEAGSGVFRNHDVYFKRLTIASNTFGAESVFKYNTCMVSKPFRINAATNLVLAVSSFDTFQDTVFVVDQAGRVQGKIYPGVASAGTPLSNSLTGVWLTGTPNKYAFALLKRLRVVSSNTTTATIRGVTEAFLDYGEESIGLAAQLGGNLHIPGGFLKAYDGYSVVEHGFHMYPEIAAITPFGVGGLILAGTYQYVAVWEWVDAQGQVHRSAPSIPSSVTTSGSTSSVEVGVMPLRFTDKTGPVRTEIILAVYRTKSNGRIFYKVSNDTAPIYNDLGEPVWLEFTDTLADSAIDTRPILYTTGDVVENIGARGCNVCAVVKNRLFTGGLEARNDYQFSKEFVTGEGVAFSDVFQRTLNATGGGITAIAQLDDKVVLFKNTSIFWFGGDGPVDTGAQDSFTLPANASADVGCIEPASVVEMPQGLMFKSEKGIYLLTRGLEVLYVGAEVEEFNAQEITGAVTVPKLNQVRFTTASGSMLVYDYFFAQWATFAGVSALSAVQWNGAFVVLRPTGEIWQESASLFSDAGLPIFSTVETGWVSLAGLLGYKRTYRILVLGELRGDHRLQVKLAYDFQGGWEEEFLLDPAEAIGETPYGEGAYGEGDYGSLNNYLFDLEPARQECTAIRMQIRDHYPDGVPTAGFRLSAVSFEVGIREGGMVLSSARRMN